MKTYGTLALVLVLTAALLTGCGCTNQDMYETTLAPTTHSTWETTEATTHMTTAPTTHSTTADTRETVDNGNGPLEDTTHTTTPTETTSAR